MKRGKNAIHGISLALHSSSSSTGSSSSSSAQQSQEIPTVTSSLKDQAQKIGQLKKLSGKGILSSGTWRDRHCLLVKGRLYYFESGDTTVNQKKAGGEGGGEGTAVTASAAGFVNLDYFDSCFEATTRISKASNVFVIGSGDRGFFESHSGRHYFAAESPLEMKEWVSAINSAMNKIRPKDKRTQQLREKSPHLSSITKTKENGNRMSKSKQPSSATTTTTTSSSSPSSPVDVDEIQEVTGTLPRPSSTRLDCALAKSRVKGPAGRRLPRHSKVPISYQSPSLASSSSSSGRKKVKAVIEKSDDDDEDDDDGLGHLDHDNNHHKQGGGGGSEDDKKVRDSRGRATSLSTLEKNLVNEGGTDDHQNNSNNNHNSQKSSTSSGTGASNNNNNNNNNNSSEKKCGGMIGMMRGSRGGQLETGENWRNSHSMDFHDAPTFASNHGMTYRYSSSSDESLNIVEDGGNFGGGGSTVKKMEASFSASGNKSIPPRTPIFRGSTIRHSSVTPPPCVLRRMRRDYSASSTPRSSKDLDLLVDDSMMNSFFPEMGSGARRTSSGSSLSTLTAEPHNGFSRHISFSSLQRAPKHRSGHGGGGHHKTDQMLSCSSSISNNSSNLYQSINNGSLSRGSSSANASPLMTSHHHAAGGGGGHNTIFRNHLSQGQGSERSGGSSRSSPLERNIQTIKQDLGAVVLETRQLDVDVNSLRQDVGSVQENIATVRGALDVTRERVGRLSGQVVNIERQIGVIVKEANLMRDQAAKLLEEAEASKATHEHLQEEAENMLSFLRQMASSSSSSSSSSCIGHQNQRNHCCKGHQHYNNNNNNSSSNIKSLTLTGDGSSNNNSGCGHSSFGQTKFFPQPAPRTMRSTSKTSERRLDENEDDDDDDDDEGGSDMGKQQHQRSVSVVKFSDDCKGDSTTTCCDNGTTNNKRNSGCDINLNLTELTEAGNKKTFSGANNDDHHGKAGSESLNNN